MIEEAAVLSQRLDTLLEEAERLELSLRTTGHQVFARDLECFVLDLRLARRNLATLLESIASPTTPFRPVMLAGRNGPTAPVAPA